jgi:hypothetical protein
MALQNNLRRAAKVAAVAGLAVVLNGCVESYGDKIREHRGCIGEAQTVPEKVDTCLRNTNNHRKSINVCLVDEMVPDHKIDVLFDCVDAAEHPGY